MTSEELKKYVCENDRLFPINWTEYLDILEISAGHPCTPLVLGGSDASDEEKRNRLLLQIEFASKNERIFNKLKENILSLKETDWVYKSKRHI
ncbi:hypothetical protein N9E71_03885 [Candidatus Pelagibacter sp.]|nr:hypothetical protein [Candidatus Pelagibacter sp.]|tara:strand:- start:104 stop:382 length:279 start_codon:yes stop_codon:yes gene_type:complete